MPVSGGGSRSIDPMPWGYAQLAHAPQSLAFAEIVERQLRDHGVKMHEPVQTQAPLRLLAAANMPAVIVEMGFLTNGDDAKALSADSLQTAIAEALLSAITDARAGGAVSGGGDR